MKTKLSLFAVMASAVLAALLTAGSASATILCEENVEPCPESKRWKLNTVSDFEASGLPPSGVTTFQLTDGSIFDVCRSTLLTDLSETGGAAGTVIEQMTKLTWIGCTYKNHDTIEGGVKLEFHAISGTSNATVTVRNLRVFVTSALLSCPFTTGSEAHFGTLTSSGTGEAVLHVNAVLTKEGSGFCLVPTIRFTATYTLTSPSGTPLFVKAS